MNQEPLKLWQTEYLLLMFPEIPSGATMEVLEQYRTRISWSNEHASAFRAGWDAARHVMKCEMTQIIEKDMQ